MFVKKNVVLFICLLLFFGAAANSQSEKTDEYYKSVRENLELFREVYREVTTRYVDDIDPKEFLNAGIEGMLSTLDPYSVLILEEDTDDIRIMTSGKYGGVGIVIGIRGENKILTVISPMEGTPAEKLGIRAGDEIIQIDSIMTDGFDTEKAALHMRGKPGTPVKLKIRRPGVDNILEYNIIREEIIVRDVTLAQMIDDNIGYIRLARFSSKAGAEMDSALTMLNGQGMKSLILDLRGNPGGLLEAAVEVCEKFLPKGETIVSTKGMLPESNRTIVSKGNAICENCPLVLLTDGGSASASEIVAGAIQDLDRGVIVGTNTFGKGLVQSLVNLPNGAELKLTTAKYYTPSGRLIQKVDYFGKDNPVIIENKSVSEDGDSTLKYLTTNGREVYGGGGIDPDVVVQADEISEIAAAMFGQSVFFNFSNDYLMTSTPKEALKDTELMARFEKYLEDNKFDYVVVGQKELDALKKLNTENKLSDDYAGVLNQLDDMLKEVKKLDFEKNKDKINMYLRMEIASREMGTAGRFDESLKDDFQLQKAIEVIKSKTGYDKILAGNTGGK